VDAFAGSRGSYMESQPAISPNWSGTACVIRSLRRGPLRVTGQPRIAPLPEGQHCE